jgi:hypothetical protein
MRTLDSQGLMRAVRKSSVRADRPNKEDPMERCETCGNLYERTFEVVMDETSHRFDCFECAIHALAPSCDNCGCKIVGHGVEASDSYFCCMHCAREARADVAESRA